MKCYTCGKETIVDATFTFMVDMGHEVFVIKNVPCRRCTQCGEGTHSFDVSVELDHIMDELEKNSDHIHIYDYQKQAMVALYTA